MLRPILEAVWFFLVKNWWYISMFTGIGYLLGSFHTRSIMAPAFCPNCLRNKLWQDELLREQRSEEEKAQSRRFYGLRKKDKELK